MTKEHTSIYQSGQQVLTPGVYEVVGAGCAYSSDECPLREFKSGDFFADYQGRAVCWHLVRELDISNGTDVGMAPKTPDSHTPWN